MIFALPLMSDAELVQMAEKGVVMAVVGRTVTGEFRAPVVTADHEGGAYDAVAHLVQEHGKQRIAYIHGPTEQSDDARRFAGYCRALADAGLPFTPELTGYAGRSHDWAAIALEKMVKLGLRPDAVFCFNDELAYGIYRKARQLGMQIPDDLAAIGVDDTRTGRHIHPALTTVGVPAFQMGEMAAHKLINQLESKEAEPGALILPTTLIPRGSCGCGEPGQ